jgi:hypothetical protein
MKTFFIISGLYFTVWYLIFALFPTVQWSVKFLSYRFKQVKEIVDKEDKNKFEFNLLTIFATFYLVFYKGFLLIWLVITTVYFYNKDNNIFGILILFILLGMFKFLSYWFYSVQSQLQIIRASAILNIIIIITCIILLIG